jgi:hypothetical protein
MLSGHFKFVVALGLVLTLPLLSVASRAETSPTFEYPRYGELVVKVRNSQVVGSSNFAQLRFVQRLFKRLKAERGPVRAAIRKVAPCSPEEVLCPRLSEPDSTTNTVVMEFGRNGATESETSLRAILTVMDTGSGQFTQPALALDFVLGVEGVVNDGAIDYDITISLIGMQELKNDRLPAVRGAPADPGCIGCP